MQLGNNDFEVVVISISNLRASLTIHTWKNLCFTEFSTKIYWNAKLAASDVFHMSTQSIKFF